MPRARLGAPLQTASGIIDEALQFGFVGEIREAQIDDGASGNHRERD
jgi:hypothetical protein